MANKSNNKNSKSNKTAHVLNLLAGDSHEPAPKRQSHVQSASAPSPTAEENEAMAESIRSALEEDLMAELEAAPVPEPAPQPQPEEDFQPFQPESVALAEPEPAPVPQPAPQPEPAPAPQPEPVPQPPAPQPEPVPAPQPMPQQTPPPQAKPAPPPQPEPEPEQHDQIEEVTYLNVMQALVEDRVDRYMKRFNMCTCNRCRTDVVALALSSLPAKYIVVPESEGIPMLSVYEGRYEAAVTAQIMWACQKVSSHPRHTSNSDGSMRLGAPRKSDD